MRHQAAEIKMQDWNLRHLNTEVRNAEKMEKMKLYSQTMPSAYRHGSTNAGPVPSLSRSTTFLRSVDISSANSDRPTHTAGKFFVYVFKFWRSLWCENQQKICRFYGASPF